jgi:hypothetical protein
MAGYYVEGQNVIMGDLGKSLEIRSNEELTTSFHTGTRRKRRKTQDLSP